MPTNMWHQQQQQQMLLQAQQLAHVGGHGVGVGQGGLKQQGGGHRPLLPPTVGGYGDGRGHGGPTGYLGVTPEEQDLDLQGATGVNISDAVTGAQAQVQALMQLSGQMGGGGGGGGGGQHQMRGPMAGMLGMGAGGQLSRDGSLPRGAGGQETLGGLAGQYQWRGA